MKKFLILALLIFSVSFHVEASRLDSYREILLSNSYTIKYKNVTPAPRVTSKDRVEVDGKKLYMCRLSKNGEDFFFTKYKTANKKNNSKKNNDEENNNEEDKGKWKYFGTRRNRVVANDKNYIVEILDNVSYGDADMSRLINAILPNSNENSQQVEYRFVAQGERCLEDAHFIFIQRKCSVR